MAINAIKNSGGSGGVTWDKITIYRHGDSNSGTFVLPYEVEIKAIKIVSGYGRVDLYLNGSGVFNQSVTVGQEVPINLTANAVGIGSDTKIEVYL